MSILARLKGYRTYISAFAVAAGGFLLATGQVTPEQFAALEAVAVALMGAFLRAATPAAAADPDATAEHAPLDAAAE